MFKFESRADFQKMVDARVEETLTLDYKASPALDAHPILYAMQEKDF
jgi:hypothetical protein